MLHHFALALLIQDAVPGRVIDVGVALTMNERRPIHNARILVRGGLIEAVGPRAEIAAPAGWEVLSFPESFAFPGGVDLHSHTQTGGWDDINDMVNPNNPEFRTLDTVVPWNDLYRDGVAGGVTTVNAIPGSGTNMSGAGTLVRLTDTALVDEAVLRYPGSVKVAQGYNPERFGDLGGTRMGMWWMLRWWLDRGAAAAEAGRNSDPDVEHIAGIFRKEHPFLVHTAGARDVYGTIRMFQLEAEVPVVVSHCCFSGYLAAPAIAATQAALNIGPRNYDFSFGGDKRFVGLVGEYELAGNRDMSVQTDAGVVPQEEFLYQATLAERLGCSTWEALESINSDPARQILIEDRIGRLVPGLDADIVIKAGQPLDPRSPVQLVLVQGDVVYDIRAGQRY
jgi:imidazolonepropionase-like amidohydrolase